MQSTLWGIPRPFSERCLRSILKSLFVMAMLMLGASGSDGLAGQERYEYDPIGRLVRYIDANNQVTTYTYDPAGNLLSVLTGGSAAGLMPVLSSVSPSVIRLGESKAITLTGQQLQVGTLVTSDPGMDLSNVRQTATQVLADLAIAPSAATGTQTLTFTNSVGAARISLVVAPKLPVLSVEPSPLALPPDSVARAITVRLSGADLVAHTITVASSDTNKATVSPSTVVIAPGQTSAQINVVPKLAGFVNLTLTSSTLQTVVVPVFITSDFRGVSTSYAAPVGVTVGEGLGTPTVPPVTATFQSPRVGIAVGPVLTDVTPQAVVVGATHSFTITGVGIPAGVQVSILPSQGITTTLTGVTAGQISIQLIADAAAASGLRRIVVTDGGGSFVPFADAAKSQIRLTTGQPAIDSIEPLFATRGQTMQLKVRGRHLQSGQLIVTPGIDLGVDSIPVVNADGTELVARISVAPLAATGSRTVRVVTSSGQSSGTVGSANQLTIVTEVRNDVTPVLSPLVGVLVGSSATAPGTNTVGPIVAPSVGVSVGPVAFQASPKVGVLGTSLTLVVTGVGLQAVTSATLVPADGLVVGAFSVTADGTSLSIPVTVDAAAPRTPRRVVLATAAGKLAFSGNAGDQFLVAAPSPELISVAPQVVLSGTTVAVTVRGQNFSDVTGVTFDPPAGLTAVPPFVAFEGGKALTFSLQAAAAASSGTRTVIVTTAGGSSTSTPSPANTLQVAQQVGPTYDSIFATPVGILVGSSTPAQLTDTLGVFAPLVGVFLTPTSTQVIETQTAVASNVGVVVGAASTGIAPSSPDGFLKGTSGTLSVTGFALGQVTSVSISGTTGITLGAHTANAQGTQLTIPVTVASTAVSTAFGVRMSTGSGTATAQVTSVYPSAMLFSVGALPTNFDSVSPIVLEQGKSYTFTVRGANLKDVYQIVSEPETGVNFGVGFSSPQWSTDALGEKLTVQLLIDGTAAIGSRAVRLRVPGGISSAGPTPANTITIVAPQ